MSDRATLERAARASQQAALLTAVGGAIFLGSLAYAWYTVGHAERRVAGLEQRAATLQAEIAQRERTLASLTPLAARGLGYAQPDSFASSGALDASLVASRAVDSLAQSGAAMRAGTVVRYYPRDFERSVNVNIVLPELQDAGFTLLQRPANPAMTDLGTNAIWYGVDVRLDDVKLVALLLTSAGVQVRTIRPFADATGPKRHAIEIGADRARGNDPVFTVSGILSATTFAR